MKVTSTMGSCAIGMESQVMRPSSQWACAGEVCSDISSLLGRFGTGGGLAVVRFRYLLMLCAGGRAVALVQKATTRSAFCTVHTSWGRFMPTALR